MGLHRSAWARGHSSDRPDAEGKGWHDDVPSHIVSETAARHFGLIMNGGWPWYDIFGEPSLCSRFTNGYITMAKSRPDHGRRRNFANVAQADLRRLPPDGSHFLLHMGPRVQRVRRLRDIHRNGGIRLHRALWHFPLPRA